LNRIFPTQEIGSIAKPKWRLKGYKGESLTKNEIAEAEIWGKKLGIKKVNELIEILKCRNNSQKRKQAILEWSAKYVIKLFEHAGLDIIFDGEQWRSEMYEYIVKKTLGFKFLGYVKSFDYRYFNKAACIGKPKYSKPIYLNEFIFTKKNTQKKVKLPFTGPYTLVDWTFNEYYEKKFKRKKGSFKWQKFEAKKEFIFDLIKEVIRPEINKLIDSGATWIQIDEPAATTNPTDEEMTLFVDAFNETVRDFRCTFSLHNCYSDYKILAEYSSKLRNCSQLALEFANRDDRRLGIKNRKSAYKEIKLFEDYGFQGSYGIGVIDVHTNFIESPELIRDRILTAVDIIDDPNRVCVSPDCGLRTRTWSISYRKLKNMVLGTELARKSRQII
jgi:5-methyltetrahydropteroyltriglutamate--homocysteine methyltransferase